MRLKNKKQKITYKKPHIKPLCIPKSNYALVTICIGGKHRLRYYYDFNRATMKKYCNRYGIDFIEISSDEYTEFPLQKHQQTPPHLNKAILSKYRLPAICKMYKQVLYLDADVYISPTAPNIFDIVPPEKLGVVKTNYMKNISRQEKDDIDSLVKRLGYVDQSHLNSRRLPYWNAGVMVLSKRHHYLFNHLDVLADTPLIFLEQSLFVYNSLTAFDDIQFLSESYNFPIYDGLDFRRDVSTKEVFYHGIGVNPKHDKSQYVHNSFHKEQVRVEKITSPNILSPEILRKYNRIFFYGSQSSGASFIVYYYATILKEYHAIIDFYKKGFPCGWLNDLDPEKKYIMKTPLDGNEWLDNVHRQFHPDFKIFVWRDPKDVRRSLLTKGYKDSRYTLDEKIEQYKYIEKNWKDHFDVKICYEDYKNCIPLDDMESVIRRSCKCPVCKKLFLKHYWGTGNVHGVDSHWISSKRFRKRI